MGIMTKLMTKILFAATVSGTPVTQDEAIDNYIACIESGAKVSVCDEQYDGEFIEGIDDYDYENVEDPDPEYEEDNDGYISYTA